VDCRLILDKNMGLFARWHGIISFDILEEGRSVDSSKI
jgi:hypothetical protein